AGAANSYNESCDVIIPFKSALHTPVFSKRRKMGKNRYQDKTKPKKKQPKQKNKTKSLKNVLQYTEGHYRTMQKGEALRLPLKH
ncbi:hypothetical protein RNI19_25745, partial [Salmonella enterica subsp. enterica serovar 1,4,[5],12:i:-]|uniref:hypothetical protein n=1 Tax=Salmonella enterica TaxID=28901 RepID=UPI0036DF775D